MRVSAIYLGPPFKTCLRHFWSQCSKSGASCKWLHADPISVITMTSPRHLHKRWTWDHRCNVSSALRWIGNAKSTSCQRSYLQLVFQHRQSSLSSTCHYGQVSLQTLFQISLLNVSVQQENVEHVSRCQTFHLNKVQRSHRWIEMEPTKSTFSSTLIDQSQKKLREITVDHAHEVPDVNRSHSRLTWAFEDNVQSSADACQSVIKLSWKQ